jgi:hypothetical protein
LGDLGRVFQLVQQGQEVGEGGALELSKNVHPF